MLSNQLTWAIGFWNRMLSEARFLREEEKRLEREPRKVREPREARGLNRDWLLDAKLLPVRLVT